MEVEKMKKIKLTKQEKAKKFGIKYQTFISELLHKVAQA